MEFKRSDLVWIKVKDKFISGKIVKKIMPYHGIGFDKDSEKWFVNAAEISEFSKPYHKSDLIKWNREKRINDITNENM